MSRPELFTKIPFLPLVLGKVVFQSLLEIHDHRWESKQRPILKTESFAIFKSSCFRHGATKLTQSCVCLRNPSINLFVSISATREYHRKVLRYLNFTCCRVLPLTCRIHCFGRLERHNTSVFLGLIFVPAWMHAAENRSSAFWRPCCEVVSSTKSFAKSKG